ncbi:DUF1801 domain-containing protein [Candidatus Saccharibacteria bacterium]|nr:DUF1801 domain-containing protein [Candidatus Saccharibacteria bacterium]
MRINAKTLDEYFAATGERKSDISQLHKIISSEVPDLKPYLFDGMSITMVGYGTMHYKSKSGREGDWPIIGLANQKNYISLYICLAKDGKYLPETYGDKLGKVNCGKSCIRFKKLSDLNLETTKFLLKEADKLSKDPSNYQF